MHRPAASRLLAVAFVAALAATLPGGAGAATAGKISQRFESCGGGWQCGAISVPLDYSHPRGARLQLAVSRLHRAGPARPAVFAFTGGPGDPGIPYGDPLAQNMKPALDGGRDLVVMDLRGTGQSGALACPKVPVAGPGSGWAKACAKRLGGRRAFYSTREDVRDLEAVRRALHIPSVTLYGISYGTRLALAYARAHPKLVDHMVLDSTVALSEPDPLWRIALTAAPRVLQAFCSERQCSGVLADPAAAVSQLVERLRALPAAQRKGLDAVDVINAILAADGDDTLLVSLPLTIKEALNGDLGPFAALTKRSRAALSVWNDRPDSFSAARFAATTCEDASLPWPARTRSVAARSAALLRMAASLPAGQLGGFGPADAVQAGDPFCAGWPESRRRDMPAMPVLGIPTLLLAGRLDLTTPLEQAQEVASRLTQSRLLVVPGTGHDVLDTEPDGCAAAAVGDFFADHAIADCPPVTGLAGVLQALPRWITSVISGSSEPPPATRPVVTAPGHTPGQILGPGSFAPSVLRARPR